MKNALMQVDSPDSVILGDGTAEDIRQALTQL